MAEMTGGFSLISIFRKIKKGFKSHKKNIMRFMKRDLWKKINYLRCIIIPYEKISCKVFGGHVKIIRVFGCNCLFIDSKGLISWKEKIRSVSNLENVMYLKVDRISKYTFHCIQHWLDVAHHINRKVVIVCDNKVLEKQIMRKCVLTTDTVFLKSYGREISNIADLAYTGYWKKPAYAHLTPFYHAYKNNISNAWMIDGDDTSFLHTPMFVSDSLIKVENIAQNEQIDGFSLDMWWSVTNQSHWTFGVAYFRGCNHIWKVFNSFHGVKEQWINELNETAKTRRSIFNADDFINYFRVKNLLKIESFFIDNTRFMHWDDPLGSEWFNCCQFFEWRDGKLYMPLNDSVDEIIDRKGEYNLLYTYKIF